MARLYSNIKVESNHKIHQRLKNVVKPIPIEYSNPWFQEIEPTSFYSEEDLERSVILNLESVFPQFWATTFKKLLKNPTRKKGNTPDLALVKKDYSEWYVIEVELSNHNVKHIQEQVDTFYRCNYNTTHADYLYSKNPHLDQQKLRSMVSSFPPKLMVVINETNSSVNNAVKPYNCSVCIFQIFLDKDSNPIYRLNGEHPIVYTEFCFCQLLKSLPYTVKILDDDNFIKSNGFQDGSIINIAYNTIISKWELISSGTEYYLVNKSSKFPLEPSTKRYILSKMDNNFTFIKG